MFSNSWPFDWRLIVAISERFPDAQIIVGGEHATACSDYILTTCREVDIVAMGEGEETMVDLVNTIRTSNDLSRVAGIAFRDGEAIHTTKRRKRIGDIDNISPGLGSGSAGELHVPRARAR